MNKLFKYLVFHPIIALLALVVLLLVAVLVLSATQTGSGILAQAAVRAVPALELSGVKGSLVDRLEVDSLVWMQDGIKVDAQQAVFKPVVALPLPTKITVQQLTAKRLVVDLPPSADTPYQPITIPDLRLPINAELGDIALEELVIKQGEMMLVLRDVALSAHTRDDTLHITRLEGELAGELGQVWVSGQGEMALTPPYPLHFKLDVKSNSRRLGAGELNAQASGELLNYGVSLWGDWQYADYPPYKVDVQAQGNFESMQLQLLSLQGAAGEIAAQGRLTWAPELLWDIQASADKLKPGLLVPDIDGELDVVLWTQGSLAGEGQFKLQLDQLEGVVRDYPIDVSLFTELKGDDVTLHMLNAEVGDNKLSARSQSESEVDVRWAIDAPRLSQLHPEARGELRGDGRLLGTLNNAQFDLTINQLMGQVLDYPVNARGQLALKDQVISARDLDVTVANNRLTLDGVADEAQGIDWTLDAMALGKLKLHPALSGQLAGEGNVKGLLDGSRLALRVDQLAGKLNDYELAASGAVLLEDDLLSAQRLKLVVGGNTVTLNGQADEAEGIDWRISAPTLGQLHPDFPGSLRGHGNAQGLLDGSRWALRVETLRGKVQDYPLSAQGKISQQDAVISVANLRMDVGRNKLRLDGKADEAEGVDWIIDAPELATLHPELAGRLRGSGNIKGLTDGSRIDLKVAELNGKVQGFPISAQGEIKRFDQQLIARRFRLKVGNNRLRLDGTADENTGIGWIVDAPDLEALHPALQGGVKGHGKARGVMDGSRLAVQVDTLSGNIQNFPLKVEGELSLNDQLISANKFRVSVGKNKLRLDGVADEATGIDWRLDAPELLALHPELDGQVRGYGNARGLLDGSRLALQVAELKGELQGYPLNVKGGIKLRDQLLSADNLRLGIGKNNIRLNGVADDNTGLSWALDAPELGALHPELKGQLSGRGSAQGLLDGSRLSVKVDRLQGRVQDYPVSARGEIKRRDQLISANNFRLNAGRNALRLNGVADERTGLDWTLDAPDLASLHPELQGQLKGRGNAKGLLDGSRLTLQIANLQGRLQQFPLKVSGRIERRDQQLSAQQLRINMGGNQLLLDGVADERRGLNWTLEAPKLAAVSPELSGNLRGGGNIQGLLDGSRFKVRINELSGRVLNYPVNAGGSLRFQDNILAADDFRLNMGANALRLNGVVDERRGLSWSLDAKKLVQLHPTLDGQLQGRGHVRGKLDGSLVAMEIVGLEGRIRGFPVSVVGALQLRDQKLLAVNRLRLSVGQNQLQLDGQLDEQRGLNWRVDASNLTQVAPQLKGNVRGNGQLRGVLDGSKLAVQIQALEGQINQYPLRASGQLARSGEALTARNLLLGLGQNTLKLDGSVGGAPGLSWQLEARNLAQLRPELKGNLRGNGRLSGKLDGSQLQFQVARLQGQVDGRPVQASGTVNVAERGKKIALDKLQLNAGNNRVALNGSVSDPLELSWQVNGADLAKAWPGLAGRLQGEGTVRGSRARPQVQGTLRGSNLRYQDIALQALDVSVSQRGANYTVDGRLRNLQQGENTLTRLDLMGQGTLQQHSATLGAVHKDGRLDLALAGSWQKAQWNGVVNTLGLRETLVGDWRLGAPVKISASAQQATLSNACLLNRQQAQLCSKVSWTAKAGVTAEGKVQQLPIALAQVFLPRGVQLPGKVSADYAFQQRDGRPVGQLKLRLPDSSITLSNERGKPEVFQYSNAQASLVLNDRTAALDAQLDLLNYGQVRSKGTVVLSPGDQQHRLDVRTTVEMPSISWLQRFAPPVDALQGQVNADIRVVGLLSQPQITGLARLQGGSLYLPETGSKIDDINLTAQASGANKLVLEGTLRAGAGKLKANGNLQLANLQDWRGTVQLQGENLLLVNSHEVQAQVSPNLQVRATPQSVAITGVVRIPETTINLRELPTGASVVSEDIVIVSGRGKKPLRGNQVVIAADSGKPLYIQPNVIIELGDSVTFNGFGFDARLAGKMRILRNRQGVIAEGALNVVDGVYKAYGQKLRVDRGRLLFNGPVENPGLDVRASRTIEGGEDIVVGIELGGTVKVPESSLFSNPLQTQTDTLSYLLTGSAVSGLSGSESAILTQAITSLGVAGGESLAQKLGGQLGLDSVGLNTRGGDYKQSELTLGKRLGPKLYIKYIVGLFDSLQKVAVNYQVNKRLELEATSGVNQSIDLIYKIDTNRGIFGQ